MSRTASRARVSLLFERLNVLRIVEVIAVNVEIVHEPVHIFRKDCFTQIEIEIADACTQTRLSLQRQSRSIDRPVNLAPYPTAWNLL